MGQDSLGTKTCTHCALIIPFAQNMLTKLKRWVNFHARQKWVKRRAEWSMDSTISLINKGLRGIDLVLDYILNREPKIRSNPLTNYYVTSWFNTQAFLLMKIKADTINQCSCSFKDLRWITSCWSNKDSYRSKYHPKPSTIISKDLKLISRSQNKYLFRCSSQLKFG